MAVNRLLCVDYADYKAKANKKVLFYQTLMKIKGTDVSSWYAFLIVLQQYLIANELVCFITVEILFMGKKKT